MHVLILYGAPAVGKLTVANALAKLTGFQVLHNHLLIDLSHSLFTNPNAKREATQLTRQSMIDLAAKHKHKGLILTFVYAKDREPYLHELKVNLQNKGHTPAFIYLYCSQVTAEKRVTETSRKKYNKLISPKGLKDKLKTLDAPFAQLSTKEGMSLSTNTLAPEETAKKIITTLELAAL